MIHCQVRENMAILSLCTHTKCTTHLHGWKSYTLDLWGSIRVCVGCLKAFFNSSKLGETMCRSITCMGLCFECLQMDWGGGGGRGQHIHLNPFAVFGMRPESKFDSPVGPAHTPTTSNHTPRRAGSALVFLFLLGRNNYELSRCQREHVQFVTSTGWLEYLRITQSPCCPHTPTQ